jgi:hypothetical protein
MRSIKIQTEQGQMELQVAPALSALLAKRNGVPEDALTDGMILGFFREASDVAFQRATAEYLDTDGKTT